MHILNVVVFFTKIVLYNIEYLSKICIRNYFLNIVVLFAKFILCIITYSSKSILCIYVLNIVVFCLKLILSHLKFIRNSYWHASFKHHRIVCAKSIIYNTEFWSEVLLCICILNLVVFFSTLKQYTIENLSGNMLVYKF